MTTTGTGTAPGGEDAADAGHADFLVVGAGISGIGAAHVTMLQRSPAYFSARRASTSSP